MKKWITAASLAGIAAPFTGPGVILLALVLFTLGAIAWRFEQVR